MPTYQYACKESACGHRFEAVQSFSDDPIAVCPVCEGQVRKVFSAVGVVFKGSGFYRNDSREPAKSSASAKKENGSKENGSKDGASKDGASKDGGTGAESSSGSGSGSGEKKAESSSSTSSAAGSGSSGSGSSSSSSGSTSTAAAS